MNTVTIAATVDWLKGDPSLAELSDRFPDEWNSVERDVLTVVRTGDTGQLADLAARASKPLQRPKGRGQQDAANLLSDEVRRRMTIAMIREVYVGMSTGLEGTVKFGRLNGWLLQGLLFEKGLVRKPVRLRTFEFVWRIAWQRRRLMPLVRPKGVYCFYSRELVDALTEVIGDRAAVEIAAGDGTLTRFLNDAGSNVIATDDHSWKHAVQYPDFVRRQNATTTLRAEQPEVVLCSWPPAGNKFERDVFKARSVQTYIVVTTRIEHEAGDWAAYRSQKNFEMEERADLGRLVLPASLDPIVLVFNRIN